MNGQEMRRHAKVRLLVNQAFFLFICMLLVVHVYEGGMVLQRVLHTIGRRCGVLWLLLLFSFFFFFSIVVVVAVVSVGVVVVDVPIVGVVVC